MRAYHPLRWHPSKGYRAGVGHSIFAKGVDLDAGTVRPYFASNVGKRIHMVRPLMVAVAPEIPWS